MASATSNGYKYLEFREHPWRKSPYIIGTNINVGLVVPDYKVNYQEKGEKGPEEFARNRSLPLDAVLEMLDWASKNDDIITRDCREGYKRIKEFRIPQVKLKELIKKAKQ